MDKWLSNDRTGTGPARREPQGPLTSKPRESERGLVSDSRTVAVWNLVSRASGFVRVVTMAAVLGPTYFANIFQTALLLPSVLFALLGGALAGPMLVPRMVRWIDSRDDIELRCFSRDVLGLTIIALALIAIISFVLGPLLLIFATAAVHDATVRAEEQRIGLPLLAMILPQLILYGVAAIGAAVQQAHGRFALAAAAPAAENLVSTSVFIASALIFGTGADIGAISMLHLAFLGIGMSFALAVHAGLQWFGAYRSGIFLLPTPGWRNTEIRRLGRLACTSSGYTALYNLVYFAAIIVAGRVPGGAVALQTGFNFSLLPVALGAFPLAAAQLPRLSRSFNELDHGTFVGIFERSLALSRFITLPSGLFLLAAGHLIAQSMAFGQMATTAGVSILAACIGGMGVGVLGEAATTIMTSASYARHDGRLPFIAMVLRTVVAGAGMGAAIAFAQDVGLLWTVSLSLSIANLASAAYLYRGLAAILGVAGGWWKGPLFGDASAAAVAILPCVLVVLWNPPLSGRYQEAALALVVALTCGGTYLALQWGRGSKELAELISDIPVRDILRRSEKTSG